MTNISSVQNQFQVSGISNNAPTKIAEKSEGNVSFSSILKDSIQELNNTQVTSDRLTDALIKGENVELHQVLIASQKASITMQATLEVRNKVVEAYQEVMRMNI